MLSHGQGQEVTVVDAGPGERADPHSAQRCYGGRRYTSARLIGKDLAAVRYPVVRARMRLPGGRGIWPASWMLGLLLNVAVGGTASVPPDEPVTFPRRMLADYVRAYVPSERSG